MSLFLDWNKLSDKKRDRLSKAEEITFIPGPVDLSKNRVKQIIRKAVKQKDKVLFGCLKDEWIPGFEGSLQFHPLKFNKLKRLAEKFDFDIICHFHKDTKYIIEELKPEKVIFINGSWSGPIHYSSVFWKAIDADSKIKLESPFVSETEAKKFTRKIEKKYQKNRLFSEGEKYSDEEIFGIIKKREKQSWDWVGQVAAALVKDGRVLALSHNRVLPYEGYQMYVGSPRERKQIPSQEMIETHLTNHAECEVLEKVRHKNIALEDTCLYINIFPCPVCAKILSRTEIRGIIYNQDHNLGNDIGYKLLEMSGKKLRRVVV